MRRSSVLGLLLAAMFACAPAFAAMPPRAPTAVTKPAKQRGPVATWTHKGAELVRKKYTSIVLTLKDPARRHLAMGSGAVTVGGIFASAVIDVGLMSVALPPLAHIAMAAVVSPLLSNAVPTLGQHFLQQKLHVMKPEYFAAEEDMSGKELLVSVGLSTAVGWVGGAAIDKAFSWMPFSLDLGAIRPMLRPAAKKLASFTLWGAKQSASQLISDAATKVDQRVNLSGRIANFMHAKGDDAVGGAPD